MISYFVRHSTDQTLHTVGQPPMEHAWVYGSAVNDDELNRIVATYELDNNIVQDIKDKHELPRVEYSDGELYAFARTPHQSPHGNVTSEPFLAVLKGSVLITLSTDGYVQPDEVFGKTNLTTNDSSHLFIQLLNRVVMQYSTFVNATSTYTLNTSQRLKTKEVTNEDFIHFVTVESELREYNVSLSGIRAVLERLRENKRQTFTERDQEIIDDTVLHIDQLLVAIVSYTQTLTSIRNAYATITNNMLNRRIKTLTVLTVIVMLPGVFYGMYGMNIALPGAHNQWAFTWIVGFSILMVAIAAWIVRRMKF